VSFACFVVTLRKNFVHFESGIWNYILFSMSLKISPFCFCAALLLALLACTPFRPCPCRQAAKGPYIDSLGLAAAQARLESISPSSPDLLISQAITAPEQAAAGKTGQPEYFQSLEDNYQKYRKLFSPIKKAPQPAAACRFDLLQTFTLQVYDAQPFMNAILHTLGLADCATLDFEVKPYKPDTLLAHVAFARTSSTDLKQGLSISEGNVDLYIALHTIILASAAPVNKQQ
jgi:hypothetical protein